MNTGINRNEIASVEESFNKTQSLLSETALFLSLNTNIYPKYEHVFQELNRALESNPEDREVIEEVRGMVAELRSSLRRQGYNLKVGSFDLKVDGFRNEDAAARGFKRCVVMLLDDGDVLYRAGTSNHIEMEKAIRALLAARGQNDGGTVHHLWFNWINRVLVLSGAASESPDNLDLLVEYAAQHKDYLLKKLMRIS